MKSVLFGAALMAGLLAAPASAQHVITNPGWCAQFYPNANCQNYGRGNPYTSYGWRRAYNSSYGYRGHHRYYQGHRYHRRHLR
jgi:opacity protein-like surface antigen